MDESRTNHRDMRRALHLGRHLLTVLREIDRHGIRCTIAPSHCVITSEPLMRLYSTDWSAAYDNRPPDGVYRIVEVGDFGLRIEHNSPDDLSSWRVRPVSPVGNLMHECMVREASSCPIGRSRKDIEEAVAAL